MLKGFISSIGGKLSSIVTKKDMYSMVDLECNDNLNPYNMVRNDGGLVTFIEISGTPKLIGSDQFEYELHMMIDKFKGELKKEGHKVEYFFYRDPFAGEYEVRKAQKGSLETALSMDLDMANLYRSKERVLGKKVAKEKVILALHTTPQILPYAVQKRENKKRVQANAFLGIKPGERGMSPFVAYEAIRRTHDAYVNNYLNTLQTFLIAKKMTSHEAIKAIRQIYIPQLTSDNYRPHMINDRVQIRDHAECENINDLSWIMQPSVSEQLLPCDGEVCKEDPSVFEIDNTFFAPINVELGPEQYKPFSDLFSMVDKSIAWSYKVSFETGDRSITSKLSNKRSIAMILSLTNPDNKRIKEDIEKILSVRREPKVIANMQFCTWYKVSQTDTLTREEAIEEVRKSRDMLVQAIQSWGSPDLSIERGDAAAAFFSSLPGLKKRSVSPSFVAMLGDVIGTTPFTRPSSPYEEGSMLFTTLDNRLWPYMPWSSLQKMHIDLIYARPGSGKSVLMSVKNLALLTRHNLDSLLPRIACLDIGYSSKLFTDMVQNMLPEHKRHLALSVKLQNTREFGINIFDTPLGCDYPLPVDRTLIANLVNMILTPAEGGEIEGIAQLSSVLIDEVYDYKKEFPSIYEPYIDREMDEIIKRNSIEFDDETEWVQIRDQLFSMGLTVEAMKAHLHCVPTLTDLSVVLSRSNTIKEIFSDAKTSTHEPLLKACQRQLLSASRDFPILNGRTRFTIDAARILSFDLMDIAPQGGKNESRQTSIMYMTVFNMLTKEFFRNKDVLPFIPEAYRNYHLSVIEANSNVPNHLCLDEFHRTSHAPQLRENIVKVMREGRKFSTMVTLCSQRETDYTEDMKEIATNIWILDKGTNISRKYLQDVFQPSKDAMRQLKLHVNGPNEEGANMLYLGVNAGMDIEQIINLRLTPSELWALSTTPCDRNVRDKLTSAIGYGEAIKTLSDEFPSGSCFKYLESLKQINKEDMDVESDENDQALANIKKLTDELIKKHMDKNRVEI